MASTGSGKVYDFVCQKIEAGEWRPGDKIWTEEKLCKSLHVSRVAVRDAVGQLVTQMRLQRKQGSGTYVQEGIPVAVIAAPSNAFTKKDILDIDRFRIGFETENVRAFMMNENVERIRMLEETYENMRNNADNPDAFCENDFRFHEIIAEGTENRFVIQIQQMLADTLLDHQKKKNRLIGSESGLHYHELVLKYIKEGDVELATMFMRRHIERTLDSFDLSKNE